MGRRGRKKADLIGVINVLVIITNTKKYTEGATTFDLVLTQGQECRFQHEAKCICGSFNFMLTVLSLLMP